MSDARQVVLVLRDEPHGHQHPFPIRLRLALKSMLRAHGLRVVEIKEQPKPQEDPTCSSN